MLAAYHDICAGNIFNCRACKHFSKAIFSLLAIFSLAIRLRKRSR